LTKGDLFKSLKEDHNNVMELFNETIENGEVSKFPTLKKKLEVHMTGEESVLYPAMEFIDKEIVEKSQYEHDLAWNKLTYLDNTPPDDPEWILNLKELKDLIKKHVDREEKELFPEASEVLSEEAEEDMIKIIEETKEENI
jgi:hemerythrin-like domain-containing protein